ncbi:cytochrome P450 [Phascolomyces articulosus]|uniref:Cytochrome P450 n=1 Tax=Phascolomyces articulosus TaxID=60185 RepID=A0AAD5PFG4_9FUNG|nr:cytochrome P450 [Phascolomyces articulosus]
MSNILLANGEKSMLPTTKIPSFIVQLFTRLFKSDSTTTPLSRHITGIVAIFSMWGIYNYVIRNVYRKIFTKESLQIPTPKGKLPYFGHFFQIINTIPSLKFDEFHRQYGPILQLTMGVKPWIVIGDKYIANDILKSKGAVTSGRPYHLFLFKYHTLGARGPTFTNPDKRWKKVRSEVQEILAPKNIDSICSTIEQEATRFCNLLCNWTREHPNTGIDIVKDSRLVSLNIIMQTCFGRTIESPEDPLFNAIIDLIDTTMKWGGPESNVLGFLPLFRKMIDFFNQSEKKMADFIEQKRNPIINQLIQESLEADTPCFVKEMDKVKDEQGFEYDDILATMFSMLNAGGDTTAVTISWAFVTLCHHRDTQRKIQQEIDTFIKKYNRFPTFKERDQFPFMISTQKECFRYRPANHIALPHESTKDFEYNGCFIPKGTTILSNTYSMSHNTSYYEYPDQFMPERFIDDPAPFYTSVNSDIEKRHHFAFGWGRRVCPGIYLAEVSLFHVWVRVFASTTIEPPLDNMGKPIYPNLNAYYNGGIVVKPLEKANLRFVERTDRIQYNS